MNLSEYLTVEQVRDAMRDAALENDQKKVSDLQSFLLTRFDRHGKIAQVRHTRVATSAKKVRHKTMTPSTNGTETLKLQNSVFDLDSFDDVTLVKEVTFTPATSPDQALAAVGNDSAKFLQLINEGLRSFAREQAKEDKSGWLLKTEDGTEPFSGTPVNADAVNTLRLTLAKTIFGYSKDMTPEQKKAAKEQAGAMIKNTETIREGLKKGMVSAS